MDYFKETEELLYSVPIKEAALVQLQRRRDRLIKSGAPTVPAGTDTAKNYVRGTFISDTMNELCELADVMESIASTKEELEEIKAAVEAVPVAEYKKLLKLWYWAGESKESIAEAIDRWSRTSVYTKRNQAVYMFARIYWGSKVERLKN